MHRERIHHVIHGQHAQSGQEWQVDQATQVGGLAERTLKARLKSLDFFEQGSVTIKTDFSKVILVLNSNIYFSLGL